ncbi:MAG: TonB-dependent receptor [Rubrivivax sp.]|nr:TonB-dependent receptor [Rubrivivax sp.]
MHRPPFTRQLLALASGMSVCAAHAQDVLPQETIVISGSRTAINPNTPAATDSIDRARLADLNIANPEDSIKYLPNIGTRKRYIGDRNGGVETRGTNNRQTARALVLADGVLLSNLLGSQNQIAPRWSMVFPEEIDRVDVIYGPFSALYSGNAMGAAVLFTTRMPQAFEAQAAVQLQRQAFRYLGTDQSLQGQLANAFVGSREGPWSWQIGLSRLDSTSQPTSFAAFRASTTPATGADRIVSSGFYRVQDRFGADTVIAGVGGGGIERTQQTDLKLKLGYDFSAQWQARLTATRWSNERQAGAEGNTSYLRDASGAPLYAGNLSIEGRRYSIGAGTFAPRRGEDEHRLLSLTLKSSHREGWNLDAVVSAYDIAKDQTRTAATAPPAAFSGGAGSLNVQDGSGWQTLDLKLDRRPADGEDHWLTLGLHHSRTDFRQTNFATANWLDGAPSGTNSQATGSTRTSALFIQDAWSWTSDWKAILGLRLERWEAVDGRSSGGTPASIVLPDRREQAVSPKLALEFSPTPQWLARASLARATRFPTPMELFFGNVSAVQLASPNPNLKPESGLFADLTLERWFSRGSARLTFFQEAGRDTIFNLANSTTVPSNSLTQNVDRVRTRGLELAFDTRGLLLPRLDLSGSLAFNDAVIQRNRAAPATQGLRFPGVPRVRASFIGIWRFDDHLNISLAGRHSGEQFGTLENNDTVSDAFNGISRFTVLDARLNARLNRHVRLSLGVDNLANRVYSNGHPFPARSAVAELKLSL